MKTIRVHQFGGPEVLKLEEVPAPTVAPGQVLVRMQAIGVNPVDAYIRAGTYGGSLKPPYTPGTDGAGVIESVAADVTQFKKGDRVYVFKTISGAYAELVLCEQATVVQLPQHVSFEQGAAIGVPCGTAYRALVMRGQAKAAETILVHGASGGVGIAAVQLARAAGMIVIGTAGGDAGRELVRREGAHHALDHASASHLNEIMSLTNNRGVDLIVEMLANKNLGSDLGILAPRGRVVVVGSRGPVEINPRDTMGREADIRGMTLNAATPADLREIHAALGAALENRSLRPVVGERIPLAEAARAHREIMEHTALGKMVLLPG